MLQSSRHPANDDTHRHAVEILQRADALLFGRVTYEMMGSAWRATAPTGTRPEWMEPFARTIDAAKKYVVSSTLEHVDWNAEPVHGALGTAVSRLKQQSGSGLFVGGVTLPLALAELGLIDEYEFVEHPRIAGRGPTLFAGLSQLIDLELVDRGSSRREQWRGATSRGDSRRVSSPDSAPAANSLTLHGVATSARHHEMIASPLRGSYDDSTSCRRPPASTAVAN